MRVPMSEEGLEKVLGDAIERQKQLEVELREAQQALDERMRWAIRASEDAERAEAQLEALREALEFYANDMRYELLEVRGKEIESVEHDRGSHAREALLALANRPVGGEEEHQCKGCGTKLYYGSTGYKTGFCGECAWKYATDQPVGQETRVRQRSDSALGESRDEA